MYVEASHGLSRLAAHSLSGLRTCGGLERCDMLARPAGSQRDHSQKQRSTWQTSVSYTTRALRIYSDATLAQKVFRRLDILLR